MLPFMKEKISIWEHLVATDKPIVIYGMGDGAVKILNICNSYGIKIKEVFASDDYVRGHSFLEFKVKKLSEIEEEYGDFIILLAFAAFKDKLLNEIYSLSEKHELYAPDVPVVGGGLMNNDYFIEHQSEFLQVYNLLGDEFSKKVYADVLDFKLTGKIEYLSRYSTTRVEDYQSLLPLKNGMDYMDLGAYDGDTIREVLEHISFCNCIYAFEPDAKNFRKLTENTKDMDNVFIHNIGSYDQKTTLQFDNRAGRNSALSDSGKMQVEVNSVDNILDGKNIDYIKMDVEGAEYQTVIGATKTIKAFAPALGVAGYHRNEDLFALPLLIKKLNPRYKIYIRHNHYIPAWETIIYAV